MTHRVFLVLVLGMTALGWGQGVPRSDDSRNEIPFEINRKFEAILIRAQVNGQPATLIVDTGSSHTILSSDLLQVRTLALQQADAPTKGSGYVGRAAWAKATLQIGTMTWHDRTVLAMDDLRSMSNSMGHRVDGIIGEDVLKEFSSVVLDFKHQRLLLLH